MSLAIDEFSFNRKKVSLHPAYSREFLSRNLCRVTLDYVNMIEWDGTEDIFGINNDELQNIDYESLKDSSFYSKIQSDNRAREALISSIRSSLNQWFDNTESVAVWSFLIVLAVKFAPSEAIRKFLYLVQREDIISGNHYDQAYAAALTAFSNSNNSDILQLALREVLRTECPAAIKRTCFPKILRTLPNNIAEVVQDYLLQDLAFAETSLLAQEMAEQLSLEQHAHLFATLEYNMRLAPQGRCIVFSFARYLVEKSIIKIVHRFTPDRDDRFYVCSADSLPRLLAKEPDDFDECGDIFEINPKKNGIILADSDMMTVLSALRTEVYPRIVQPIDFRGGEFDR